MSEPKTSARKLKQAERRGEALRLRKAGCSYAQIGVEMGFSDVNAYKLVALELKRINEENRHDAEEIRTLELERLDALLHGLWEKASNGHEGSVHAYIKVMERRHKLLGIDAPAKVDSHFSFEEDLASARERLSKVLAQTGERLAQHRGDASESSAG